MSKPDLDTLVIGSLLFFFFLLLCTNIPVNPEYLVFSPLSTLNKLARVKYVFSEIRYDVILEKLSETSFFFLSVYAENVASSI